MNQNTYFNLNHTGVVVAAGEAACSLIGVPMNTIMDAPLIKYIRADHRIRLESELIALINHEEDHGRLSCIFIGLDDIGRRLMMRLVRTDKNLIHVDLSSNIHVDRSQTIDSSLANADRLLPVLQRIMAICRRATTKEDLLSNCLAVMAEVTAASSAAAIGWGSVQSGWPVTAIFGPFDEACLSKVFRTSVIGRLAQSDVIVKEFGSDQPNDQRSIILIPLIANDAPEGIIALMVNDYSVLTPQEQQGLAVIGRIMSLELNNLNTTNTNDNPDIPRSADTEATIALGRLSAGLAHEINNAVTVLRNNIEQLAQSGDTLNRGSNFKSSHEDSINAIETIRNLTNALRAFAPEETSEIEEIDIQQVLEMVIASMRFYSQRGISVSLTPAPDEMLIVCCHSHYLIRSLFLIFVELLEASLDTGHELNIEMTIEKADNTVDLIISVSAGPFVAPAMLLGQLNRNGAITKHITKSGAKLSHSLDDGRLNFSIAFPPAHKAMKNRASNVPPSEHVRASRRGTILLVDDEPAILRSMRRILELDHDVLAAESGAEALQIVQTNPRIDVMLLDVYMSDMNGITVHKEISRLYPSMVDHIVFMTGGKSDKLVSEYLRKTNCSLIEKPIDISALNQLIAERIK